MPLSDIRRRFERVPSPAWRTEWRLPRGPLAEIEPGPLAAGAIVLGVPVAVLLALVLASDGVRLGGFLFAVLVFGLFLWGFFYEVRRLTRLP